MTKSLGEYLWALKYCALPRSTQKYVQYCVERDAIAINISAVTNIPMETIIKHEEKLGQTATIEHLQHIYEFVLGGGILNYAKPTAKE